MSLLALILAAAPARAWTNAHVDRARVEAETQPDGRTRVAVELALRVEGGWLTSLELAGFDAVVAVDSAQPARLTSLDGTEHVPSVTLSEQGNLTLGFARKLAPRRGEYTLTFAYFAEPAASADAAGLRVGFTLPGFEAGLERAQITLDVPAGAEAVIDPELTLAPHIERTGERTRVSFERVHVPRSTPWTVLVSLPSRAPHAEALPGVQDPRPALLGGLIALLVVGLGHAARALRARRRERVGAFASVVARLPRGAAELSAIAGACWWCWSLEAALLCWLASSLALALVPARRDALRTPFGRLVHVPRAAREAAVARVAGVRWGFDAPFDATTVLGAALVCALVLVPAAFPGAYAFDGAAWGLGLVCAAPAWFAGTRLDAEPVLREQIAALSALAGELDVQGWGLALRWVETSAGPRGVRLSFTPAARLTGVWSVDAQVSARVGEPLRLRVSVDGALEAGLCASFAQRLVAAADGVDGRRVLLFAESDVARFLGALNVSAARRAQAFLAQRPRLRATPEPTAKSA